MKHEDYLFLIPALAVVLIFTFFPYGMGVWSSFQYWHLGISAKIFFVGLDNYVRMAGDLFFGQALRNTIYFSITSLIFAFLLGLAAALVLNEEFRGRSFFRVLLISPYAVPGVAAALAFTFMFGGNPSLIGDMLSRLGLKAFEGVAWLGDPQLAMTVIIIATVWSLFPGFVLILLAGLQSIPSTLYEAAQLDGASAVGRFRAITMPMLRPAISISLVLNTIWVVRSFTFPFIITQGGPAGSTNLLMTMAYGAGVGTGDLGLANAVSVVSMLIVLPFGIYWLLTELRGRFSG